TDGEVTYALLRGANYRKDNRLLPAGFDTNSADDRIKVAGQATDDPDFTGGGDKILYLVATPGSPGPYLVEVELLFQTISAAFISDLRQDSTLEISGFTQMFDSADQTPVTVASMKFALDPSEFYKMAIQPLRDDHGPELMIAGPAGGSVDIETSTDLDHWEILETLQQTVDPFIYEDTQSGEALPRFYQLRWPVSVEEK
ncbi:MAG: hypothetical protein KJT03_14210, partial [Verrucomicrobiae bacterium]|nr:hypothetical protein [Verrucomicrobiae bacterium]